jgi:hypothetical protein
MKKCKRNKAGKKKQPKKRERVDKKYRTNVDTISLNVEQFSDGVPFNPYYEPWMDVVINPRRYYKKGVEISR